MTGARHPAAEPSSCEERQLCTVTDDAFLNGWKWSSNPRLALP